MDTDASLWLLFQKQQSCAAAPFLFSFSARIYRSFFNVLIVLVMTFFHGTAHNVCFTAIIYIISNAFCTKKLARKGLVCKTRSSFYNKTIKKYIYIPQAQLNVHGGVNNKKNSNGGGRNYFPCGGVVEIEGWLVGGRKGDNFAGRRLSYLTSGRWLCGVSVVSSGASATGRDES